MSEEVKTESKCFCQNKAFRKFLITALGTFVGVYAALSLFAATHRPPMFPPCPMGFNAPAPIAKPCPFHHHHFDKDFNGDKGEFHKALKEQKGPSPFEQNRNFNKD